MLANVISSFVGCRSRRTGEYLPADSKKSERMRVSITTKAIGLCLSVFAFAAAGFAQPAPFLQDIKVVSPTPTPAVRPVDPLVKKTGSASTTAASAVPAASSVRTNFPALAEVSIPGYTGILIETLDGKTVLESNSGLLFNPASNVKVATAYAVLKTFGPEFRFATNIYTDGAIDRSTATLIGNLYISGRDPMFGYEHAVTLASELNRLGIRSITGDLVVTDNFAMNYNGSAMRSAEMLHDALNSATRSAAATKVWLMFLQNSGRMSSVASNPSVSFTGGSYVQPIPSSLTHLFTHESAPMREIIKATLCYSNNFLAERLGDMLGGPYAVARLVQQNAAVPANEFSIQTASGLGYNRVTPNAMMSILRALRSDLARYRMTFSDIMPVAGVDKGTLESRFASDFAAGSVVGKTGTLGVTDSGVSALAGEMNTRNGRLLFVIFNQRGNVPRFRSFQNNFVSLVQSQFGGPATLEYQPTSLDARLARTRIINAVGQVIY